MGNINSVLGGNIFVAEVNVTTAATKLSTLLSFAPPDGTRIEVRFPANLTAGTARAAILYGNSSAQTAYIPAGTEERLQVPADKLYIKSVSGTVPVNVVIITG